MTDESATASGRRLSTVVQCEPGGCPPVNSCASPAVDIGVVQYDGRFSARASEGERMAREILVEPLFGEQPNSSQCVYFLHAASAGAVKIGYTSHPRARLSSIRGSSAETLDLLLALPCSSMKAESVLHKSFASDRMRGEWFLYTTRLRHFVRAASRLFSRPWWVAPVPRKVRGGRMKLVPSSAVLTERQALCLRLVAEGFAARSRGPSVRLLAAQMGIRSTNGVADHLKALVRKGFLSRDSRGAYVPSS